MKKVVLSICMMIKNEEKNLKRCLDSLQALREAIPSELIIVDTGSEDNSVEIAKEYTNKVYFHEWNGNFSEMRNITIEYAKGKWIFVFDADEELVKYKELIDFLKKEQPVDIKGAVMTCINIVGRNGETSPIPTARLFRRTRSFHYSGTVHNQPEVKGKMVMLNAALHHYGYMLDDQELMERKFSRTKALLQSELEKDPTNIYYRFQLAVSYSMHQEPSLALREIIKACDLQEQKNGFGVDSSYLLGTLIQFYAACEIYDDEMVRRAKQCLEIEPTYIDVWYFLAQAYVKREEFEKGYSCYEEYLSLLKKFDDLPIKTNVTISLYTLDSAYNAHYNMALICKKEKNWEALEKHIGEIFSLKLENAIKLQAYFLLLQVDFEKGSFAKHANQYGKLFLDESVFTAQIVTEAERLWKNAAEEIRIQYSEFMGTRDDLYGELNKARVDKNRLEVFAEKFFEADVEQYPEYFSLSLFPLMKNIDICNSWLGKFSETTLREYLKHLDDAYRDEFIMCARIYVFEKSPNTEMTYQESRLRKNICKYLLFSGDLSNDEYVLVFQEYVDAGTYFISNLYSAQSMEEERCLDLKNIEEIFFLYMYLSKTSTVGRKVELYNKARSVFPEMSEGIKSYLERLRENPPEQKARENEIEKLKKALLEHTRKLIDEKNFQEALQIIAEVEKTVGMDAEFLMLKTKILLEEQ